jgi:hypothetical protein
MEAYRLRELSKPSNTAAEIVMKVFGNWVNTMIGEVSKSG